MSNIKTDFDKADRDEKLPAGPTISNPGPILLIHAATEVKALVTSMLSRETIINETP